MPSKDPESGNGLYRGERSLHAALKAWAAQPGDRLEAALEGWVIDILRSDLLLEVQTRNFSALHGKLESLLPQHGCVFSTP